jgi:hypothetical protein
MRFSTTLYLAYSFVVGISLVPLAQTSMPITIGVVLLHQVLLNLIMSASYVEGRQDERDESERD